MSDVYNILHITDLHYTNRTTRNREQSTIIKALLDDIEHITLLGLKPDVIVFNGDLVNEADEKAIYWDLYENFIEPLLQKTRLTGDRLMLVPGNHDVMRSAVKKYGPLHREFYQRYELKETNAYYSEEQSEEVQNAKFEAFYEACDLAGAARVSSKQLYTVVDLPHVGMTFCLLNTAYSSAGGLPDVERNDYGKLVLPEYPLEDAEKELAALPKRTRFLVGHHPASWFKEDCARSFERAVNRSFAGHFSGHIHITDPQGVMSLHGACTRLQTGALHQGADKWNGYTIVRVAPVEGHLEVLPRRYAADQQKFVSAIEMGEDGKFYPTPQSRSFWRSRPAVNRKAIGEWVTETLKPYFEERHAETIVGRSLGEVFHEHPMRSQLPNYEDGPKVEEPKIDFTTICNATENFVVVGDANYGKTTLIKRIAMELIGSGEQPERLSVPALFEFRDIDVRGDGVFKALRASVPGLDSKHNVRQLLDEGLLTVLVDDVDPTDTKRLESLVAFTCQYPRCRYLLTSKPSEGLDIGIAADLNSCVSFKEVRLLPLRAKGIRAFTQQYSKENGEDSGKLAARVIATLKQAALPPTAFSVSILLEVFGGLKGDILINQVTLVERFIEYLLAKEKTSEAARAAFNFADKTRCLAFIAKRMAMEGRYELPYDELLALVSEFIDSIGYPHDPRHILDRLIGQKVLRKTTVGLYSFYLRSFLEYFIARGMEHDIEFYKWIMDSSRYLSFVHEIEFFSGLNAGRHDVLDIVSERHKHLMDAIRETYAIDLSAFDHIELPTDKGVALVDLREQLSLPKMSDEEKDDRIDTELAISDDQNAYRPLPDTIDSRHFLSLTLYSSVLRNLEHLSRESKQKHVDILLRNWAEYLGISFAVIPSIVKHRSLRVNGVEYKVASAAAMHDEKLGRMLMLYLPSGVTALMRGYLGSEKMVKQVEFDLQGSDPAILKLVRSFLLSDLDVTDWPALMSKMRNALNGKTYLSLAMMWKLNSILKMREPTKDQSDRVVDTIARLYADHATNDPKEYNRIYSQKLQELQRTLQIKQLKEKRGLPSISVTAEPGRSSDTAECG